jgi:hypothetical protein
VFQNVKKKWIESREKKMEEEFRPQLEAIRSQIEKTSDDLHARINRIRLEQAELESLEKRVQDRREDLNRVNQELRDQIRLIEAKAAPDQVWISAFQAGFNKCWDMMWEYQSEQVTKLREKIKSQAITETLERLNGSSLSPNKHESGVNRNDQATRYYK